MFDLMLGLVVVQVIGIEKISGIPYFLVT